MISTGYTRGHEGPRDDGRGRGCLRMTSGLKKQPSHRLTLGVVIIASVDGKNELLVKHGYNSVRMYMFPHEVMRRQRSRVTLRSRMESPRSVGTTQMSIFVFSYPLQRLVHDRMTTSACRLSSCCHQIDSQ